MSVRAMRLFTIGYEKASQADLLATLRSAEVKLIIDVRDRPQSRRAGFSKRQLSASAAEIGIGYVHLKALGTPAEGREAHRRRDLHTFWNIVETQLATEAASQALTAVVEDASNQVACLLCYEADWRQCHRKRVGELLEPYAFELHHLTVEPSFI